LAIGGDVSHAGLGPVRDALEVFRAARGLMEGNAGRVGGLQFHLVADGHGAGDAQRPEQTYGPEQQRHEYWVVQGKS
jgi:hypothetical protein